MSEENNDQKYIDNADTLWFVKDQGEFVRIGGKTFQRAESDGFSMEIMCGKEVVVGSDENEGVEYFQVDPDLLDDDERARIPSDLAPPDLGNLRGIFVVGVADAALEADIKIAGRTFIVDNSNGGDDGTWSVQYTICEEV
jgi:hypothetical protein